MTTAQEFFKSYKFLVGFMISNIFIIMIFGDKVLQSYLWLILMSVIIINSTTIISALKGA